jgi:hypothetical protein
MAGVLLALFLSVLGLTLSEALHRAVHAEACEPQHECAVTMLQSGQVETPVVTVTPVIVSVATSVALLAECDFIPSVNFFLLPSRGPPALLF